MSGPIRVRKRPLEVDAYLYDGTNADDIARWVGPDAYITLRGDLVIRTLEGDHKAEVGDYVMRGSLGEHYPIKPAVYADVYEPVGE